MTLSFTPTADGLAVFDRIERHRYVLRTPERVEPTPADPAAIDFPVDDAVAFRAAHVDLPASIGVYVHDEDGDVTAEAVNGMDVSLPRGTYTVELSTSVKSYLRVTAPVEVSPVPDAEGEGKRVSFAAPTRVVLGARSRHERPAATITTTDDPADVMCAVSYLGSALKTTSPERSYPTLRGHPPLLEVGDELSIPDGLERPETGVRIELPPNLEYVFPAAPLAYYLGAEMVSGTRPRLVTEGGFSYELDGIDGFEATVKRVLKHTFFLDCVSRTEGLYSMPFHEREAVEPHLDVDLADLYGRPLTEQLETHLSIPYETIEPQVPEWKLTAHVEPTADSIEILPFLVDDLAIVRSASRDRPAGPTAGTSEADAVAEFLRTGVADGFTRSAGEAARPGQFVSPERTESLEAAWVGEGAPIGMSKPTVTAFHNALERGPADGDIDIVVVCNDAQMREEHDLVRETYGDRDDLPFDVTVHRNLTTAQLREVVAEPTDFLHYIGHIDADGFDCADGKLDAHSLDAVGVGAFFLNACSSYEQGMALLEAGSIGGVVTLQEVINSGAVTVGKTLARLLNRGFPLRAGLAVASGESIIGDQYIVVGDGGLAIAQAESGTPYLCEVDHVDEEQYRLTIEGYPTSELGMGTLFIPYLPGNEEYFLNAGRLDDFHLSRAELELFFGLEDVPVRVDGRLHWSSELAFDDVF